jgi:hypothetical protein
MKNFFGPVVGAGVLLFLNTFLSSYTRFSAFFLGVILIILVTSARMGIVDLIVLKRGILEKVLGWEKIKILVKGKAAEKGLYNQK